MAIVSPFLSRFSLRCDRIFDSLSFAQSLHSCQHQWLFTSSEERQLNLATVSQNLYRYGKYLGLETLSDEQLIASRSQKILGEAFGDGVLFDLAGRVAS